MHDHHLHVTSGAWNMWDLWLLFFLLAVGGVYLWLVERGRSRFADAEPVKGWRKTFFLGGLVLWFTMQGTPIHHYGHHYLFSVHMLEMSVVYLIVPPMLLVGLPAWLVRPLLQRPLAGGLIKVASRPIVSVLLFNMLFSLYHMPLVFDALRDQAILHGAYHTLLMITAFQMWWPVVAPLPELDRLSYLRKVAYMFANGALLTPACALIIFAQTPLYESYAGAPQLFDWLARLDDQQLGGVTMKLMQELVYGTVLLNLLYKWYKQESQPDLPDSLRIPDASKQQLNGA